MEQIRLAREIAVRYTDGWLALRNDILEVMLAGSAPDGFRDAVPIPPVQTEDAPATVEPHQTIGEALEIAHNCEKDASRE